MYTFSHTEQNIPKMIHLSKYKFIAISLVLQRTSGDHYSFAGK